MAHQYEKSEVRQQQIADAALALIAEQGLSGFTTKAIGVYVGVSEGTIFRHFESKEAIVLAAITRLESAMSAHWSDDPDPAVRLESFFRARAAFVGKERSVGRLLLSEQLAQAAGETALREVRQWRMTNQNWVLACMRDVAAADRLAVAITPEQATRILQGMVATFVIDSALDLRRSVPLDRQVEEAWSALRQTLLTE